MCEIIPACLKLVAEWLPASYAAGKNFRPTANVLPMQNVEAITFIVRPYYLQYWEKWTKEDRVQHTMNIVRKSIEIS